MNRLNQIEQSPILVADSFSYSEMHDENDDARNRISRMTFVGEYSLYDVIYDLNTALVNIGPSRTRTDLVIAKTVNEKGLYSTLGMGYSSDLSTNVFPYAAELAKELTDSDLREDILLRRLGNMAGVMIAQSQCFADGNTRTARAFYGRIHDGKRGVVRAHNAIMDFEPPAELEELILRQNLVRARAGITGKHDATSIPEHLDSIPVDPRVDRSIEEASRYTKRLLFGFDLNYSDDLSSADINRFILYKRLVPRLGNEALSNLVAQILSQEEYGPAAYSLVFQDPEEFQSIDLSHAKQLVEANKTLLRLRIMSLMTGVIDGGHFLKMTSGSEDSKVSAQKELYWEPQTYSN